MKKIKNFFGEIYKIREPIALALIVSFWGYMWAHNRDLKASPGNSANTNSIHATNLGKLQNTNGISVLKTNETEVGY